MCVCCACMWGFYMWGSNPSDHFWSSQKSQFCWTWFVSFVINFIPLYKNVCMSFSHECIMAAASPYFPSLYLIIKVTAINFAFQPHIHMCCLRFTESQFKLQKCTACSHLQNITVFNIQHMYYTPPSAANSNSRHADNSTYPSCHRHSFLSYPLWTFLPFFHLPSLLCHLIKLKKMQTNSCHFLCLRSFPMYFDKTVSAFNDSKFNSESFICNVVQLTFKASINKWLDVIQGHVCAVFIFHYLKLRHCQWKKSCHILYLLIRLCFFQKCLEYECHHPSLVMSFGARASTVTIKCFWIFTWLNGEHNIIFSAIYDCYT